MNKSQVLKLASHGLVAAAGVYALRRVVPTAPAIVGTLLLVWLHRGARCAGSAGPQRTSVVVNCSIEYIGSRSLGADETAVDLILWCDGNPVTTQTFSMTGQQYSLFGPEPGADRFRVAWCEYAARNLKGEAERRLAAEDSFAVHVTTFSDSDVRAIRGRRDGPTSRRDDRTRSHAARVEDGVGQGVASILIFQLAATTCARENVIGLPVPIVIP